MEQRVTRMNLRRAEKEFGVTHLGQIIKTRALEHNLYSYRVVHIDDQDVLLERERRLHADGDMSVS